MRQFFTTIPKELDDSAMIDGCNPIGLYWRNHLPLSLSALGDVLFFTDAITHGSAERINPGYRRSVIFRYSPRYLRTR